MGDGLCCRRRSESDAARFGVVPRAVGVTDARPTLSPPSIACSLVVAERAYCSGRSAGPPVVSRSFPLMEQTQASVTLGGQAHWRRLVRVAGSAVGCVVRCRVGGVKVRRPECSEDERP